MSINSKTLGEWPLGCAPVSERIVHINFLFQVDPSLVLPQKKPKIHVFISLNLDNHLVIFLSQQDGVHTKTEGPAEKTPDQIKLMHTQDLGYVNYKRSTEMKV